MTDVRFASLVADPLPGPGTAYERALVPFLRQFFAAYPVSATAVGYHAFDDRWDAFDDTSRVARIEMLRTHRDAIESVDAAALTPDEAIDQGVLLDAIDEMRFHEETLREGAWDPLSVVHLLGNGLFALISREFAPWPHRGAALLARARGIPAALAAAQDEFTGLPGRPVSLLHLETALAQLSGITDLLDEGLGLAREHAQAGELPELPQLLEAAAVDASTALDAFRTVLDTRVRAVAEGEGRLGATLFDQKLHFTLASDLSHDELLARARRDYAAVRAEMVRIARDLWPEWVPDQPLPEVAAGDEDSENAVVRPVLDAIAREHRRPDELLDASQAEVGRIEAFCREHDVITLTSDPLKVTWTPVFMRPFGRAFLDAPGPLDRGLASHFWVTPPEESLGPEAVESYLREDNDRMIRLMCIHEGVPGHYTQLGYSNRCTSLTRTIFTSGMFAEGWAVYVTQVMMDAGYGAEDPALILTHWKFYLRAVVNAILDVAIHVEGMTEEEAIDLMVRGAFQEEDEARGKWLRARLTSTQLSTYYLGSLEMWDMEVEARQRAAAAAGAGEDAVPPQRVVGGLGETPGFDRREHLEAVISHGTPPIKWVRRMLAGVTGVPA